MDNRLWYQTGADRFSEALPIGNGSYGAMVYGNYPEFQYSLNADTLWSGVPDRDTSWHVEMEDLVEARRLLREKRYFEAEQLVQEKMTSDTYNESYVSAGFLKIRFRDSQKVDSLYRDLNLEDACARSEFMTRSNQIRTESFWSFKDHVLVTRILSEKPVSLTIQVESLLSVSGRTVGNCQILCGEAPSHVEPNYAYHETPIVYAGNSIRFCIASEVFSDGETAGLEDSETEPSEDIHSAAVLVKNAHVVQILTAMETGYRGYGHPLESNIRQIENLCIGKIQEAARYSGKELYERHCSIYHPMFHRVNFQLKHGHTSKLPTDERLKRIAMDPKEDPGLYALLFQYGRYLMLSSSYPLREDTQPANLQGIWCEDVRPMWSCNNTVNINTEMNYWLSGPANLKECEGPLIRMVEEAADSGEKTARETFGCKGWAACHNIDLWRQTTPVKGNVKWAYWPMGGVWLATHLYRHYLYTGDQEYLRGRAYPVLKKTAEFCLDWMVEEEGILHSLPSTSPENTFLDQEGRECAISDTSTMDLVLIREILQEVYSAGEILGESEGYLKTLKEALRKLPDLQIGTYGQLCEWSEDVPEADPHHRHMAHLTALHPFHQLEGEHHQELMEAAAVSIRRRIRDCSIYIGWVEAWLVNFSARLGDSREAFRHLQRFLSDCAYDNLFSLHPPLGETEGEREIFQIDGNFGIAAGILEMLADSREGQVTLLPALPEEWEAGMISGLIISGGHQLTMKWKEGVLTEAVILGGSSEKVRIIYSHFFQAESPRGKCTLSVEKESKFFAEIDVEPEQEYRITGIEE